MDPTNDTIATTISSSTIAHSITPPMSPTSSPAITTTATMESDMLVKKKQHHFSHISADSATTTDDDDLDLDHHRRSTSGTDSIYSSVTESTEPPQKDPSPEPSKMSSLDTETDDSITSRLPIQRDEQLDPWGSNPYDQEDLASTLRFSRNPDDLDDEHAEEEHDTVPVLTRITTTSSSIANTRSILSPSGGRPSLTLSTTEDDSLERLDKEFERLTSGQSIQIMHTDSSPLALDFDREQLDDPRGIVERSISDKDKRIKLSKLFSRAASNGDMNRVADMLDNFRDWIDIEAQDEDGTTPLIYAACFGHVEIAFMLLEAGAIVDARDKFGWTALVWATNNKHDNMVRLLLEQGASTTAQTAKGHTVVDFLRHDPNDNTRIVQIFQEPGRRDSISSNGSLARQASSIGDDLFYQAGIEGFEEMMAENERRYKMAMESANAFDVDMADLSLADQPQLDDEGEFDWERCLPDQMFVFSSKDIRHIIDTTITNMEPTRSKAYKPIPAYILFLAARFAHYFSSIELLDELLEAASSAITKLVRSRPEDMTLTAYWLSNTSVLLHFLRKDPGLSLTTGFHQVKIEALILDMLQMLVMDAERRIDKILEPAMLDHDTIQGLDEVKFQSDWAFLWRGSISLGSKAGAKAAANATSSPATGATTPINKRASSPLSPSSAATSVAGGATSPNPRPLTRTSSTPVVPMLNRPPSPRQRKISPRTITTMLSSLLFVMQTYDIHPDIIHYVIAQLLHFVSCEVFNRMMTNKKLLSRSKALQTRLNLSILEDWIRLNNLSPKLMDQFGPLVQLLQLLQVLSLQEDFPTWVETLKKLELLNPTQVKRVVNAYRFEVNEPRLPEEIKQYVLQVAADTERMVRRQMMDRKRERPLTMMLESNKASTITTATTAAPTNSTATPSTTGSRTSTAMEDTETRSSLQITPPSPAVLLTEAEKARARQRLREQEEEASLLAETRNSKSWLPFVVPENMAAREHGIERVFVPLIPEEMMSLLDTFSVRGTDGGFSFVITQTTFGSFFATSYLIKSLDRRTLAGGKLDFATGFSAVITERIPKELLKPRGANYEIEVLLSNQEVTDALRPLRPTIADMIMEKLYNDTAHHDISAHKHVLRQWPYFQRMFDNEFVEGRSSEKRIQINDVIPGEKRIKIKDVEPKAFQVLVRFMYAGYIPISEQPTKVTESENSWEAGFLAAHLYELEELCQMAQRHIVTKVTPKMAIPLLFRSGYKYPELRAALVKFIALKSLSVVASKSFCDEYSDRPEFGLLLHEIYQVGRQ
ncbi:hypothetical protein BGZ92_008032 [Podila epicladia]|nr:hypothetical protein BGZ92_008032 [Podila epicladia]